MALFVIFLGVAIIWLTFTNKMRPLFQALFGLGGS